MWPTGARMPAGPHGGRRNRDPRRPAAAVAGVVSALAPRPAGRRCRSLPPRLPGHVTREYRPRGMHTRPQSTRRTAPPTPSPSAGRWPRRAVLLPPTAHRRLWWPPPPPLPLRRCSPAVAAGRRLLRPTSGRRRRRRRRRQPQRRHLRRLEGGRGCPCPAGALPWSRRRGFPTIPRQEDGPTAAVAVLCPPLPSCQGVCRPLLAAARWWCARKVR